MIQKTIFMRELLIFRLIITYFGTLRMRQIAPFYHFSRWGMSPEPPSTSVYFIILITYHVIFVFLARPYLYTYIRKYIK